MPPKLEVTSRCKRSVHPSIERRHPVRTGATNSSGGRSRERDHLDASGLNGGGIDVGNAVRGGDLELEGLSVVGGRVELERGGMASGENEGFGEGLDGERDASVGTVRDIGETNGV